MLANLLLAWGVLHGVLAGLSGIIYGSTCHKHNVNFNEDTTLGFCFGGLPGSDHFVDDVPALSSSS